MSEGELRLYKDLVNAERVSHIDFKLIAKKLFDELQQKENIIKEIYTKANDTSITSLDLRQYILDNLGGNK